MCHGPSAELLTLIWIKLPAPDVSKQADFEMNKLTTVDPKADYTQGVSEASFSNYALGSIELTDEEWFAHLTYSMSSREDPFRPVCGKEMENVLFQARLMMRRTSISGMDMKRSTFSPSTMKIYGENVAIAVG